jgi:hypothetical protein
MLVRLWKNQHYRTRNPQFEIRLKIMPTYLVQCKCGGSVPANLTQAGMQLACPVCSSSVKIPTIRNLKLLPLAAVLGSSSKHPTNRRSSFFLNGIAAAALIATVVSVANTCYEGSRRYNAFQEVSRNKFDLTKTEEDYFKDLRDLGLRSTPADTWDFWNSLQKDGLSEPDPPTIFRYKRYLRDQLPKLYRSILVSAVCIASFATVVFVAQRRRRNS